MSTWQTRWFILTNDNLTYFTDQSMSTKKGEVVLNHTCSIKRKAPEGSRKFLLVLENKITGRSLLLCPHDLATLSSWEQAISSVLENLGREYNIALNAQKSEQRVITKTSSADITTVSAGPAEEVLKSGFLYKQGHRVQTWTKRWFTLTSDMLTYFEDESLAVTKGALAVDQYASLTRRKAPRKTLHSAATGTDRQFLLVMYVGSSQAQRGNLLMSASSEESRLAWEVAIATAALRLKLANHVLAVTVQICDNYEPFIVPTEEPVYVIKIFRFGKQLSKEFIHFADVRKLSRRLVASGVALVEPFPRTYKRNSFGVQLGEAELESRRFQLEKWLQEMLDKFQALQQLPLVDGAGGDKKLVRVGDLLASLFGCSPEQLSAFANPNLKDYSQMVARQGDSDDEVVGPDSDDEVEETMGSGSGEMEGAAEEKSSKAARKCLSMPEKPSQLKTFNLKTLALLCQMNHIDCSTFKGHKHYVRALLETYQKRLPYLHDKDARATIRRLVAATSVESDPRLLDPTIITEIDNIFADLLYLLEVPEERMGSLQVDHSAHEKMKRIAGAVAVWGGAGTFTAEDATMLQQLCTQKQLDPFLILTAKCRLKQATPASQWVDRFCSRRGVGCLLVAMDLAYDQKPVCEANVASVLQLLLCFRVVVESDCWETVLDTRGAVPGIVHALSLQNRGVSVEALELLTELVIAGGEEAGAAVCQAFHALAATMRQKPFEELVVLCTESDPLMQCSVMALINALMLYERDVSKRVAVRQALSSLDFDQVCAEWVKEYRLAGNNLTLPGQAAKAAAAALAAAAPPPPASGECVGGEAGQGGNEGGADAAAGMYEELGFGEVALTFHTRLRPGVRVADLWVQEGLADNEESVIHPEAGAMEGFAIEVVENPLAKAEVEHSSSLDPSVSTLGKFVSDRLSLSRLSGGARHSEAASAGGPPSGRFKAEEFKARRLWFRLNCSALSWSDSFDSSDLLGSISVEEMEEVLELGALSSETMKSVQNSFTVVARDGRTYHMCADSRKIKLQWLVALKAAMNNYNLRRLPYNLPSPDKQRGGLSAVMGLRKDFDNHMGIYRSLAAEDIGAVYLGEVADIVEGRVGATDPEFDPVRLTMFINYELKNHRNGGKLFTPLQDLAAYMHGHYAPRPVVDEDELDGSKHPRAVPQSEAPLPRAPPLPFVPDAKPIKKPNIKVKQLFWVPVKPANVVNSVWRDMEEPEVAWQTFDTQFAAIQPRAKVQPRKSLTGSGEPAKPKQVALFDSKRTQNVAIACGKLKKSPEDIFDMALAMDPDELTSDVNDTILNLLLPTSDELEILKSYTGEVQDLDFTGKLFSYFSEIDRLEQRLASQRTMLSWFEQANVVFDQIHIVNAAVSEFSEEASLKAFRNVLAVVLSVGNYMNGGTRRGQVHGYRLELLLKLKDVKQTGGRRTLLHFIADHLSGELCVSGNSGTATTAAAVAAAAAAAPGGSGENAAAVGDGVVLNNPFFSSWKHMWLATKVSLGSLEVLIRELQVSLEVCMQELERAEEMENDKARIPLVERLSK
jgi:hypothetical protein